MDQLEWNFKLFDQASDPANKIAASFSKLDAQTKALAADSSKLEQAHKSGGSAAAAFGGELVGPILGALELHDGIKKLEEETWELTKAFASAAFEATAFEERTAIAFKTLTGSAGAARGLIEQAKQFSLKSALPVDEVLGNYQQLLLAKIKPIEIPAILQGAGDLSALTGGRVPVEQLTDAFARMSNEGILTEHTLRQLRSAGLDLEALSKRLGASNIQDLSKRLAKNPIDAATGISAILATIAEKEGGVLGSTTLEMADTTVGSINKIKSGWQIMLGAFEESPTFGGFRSALANVAALFNPATEGGKALEASVGKILTMLASFGTTFLNALPALFGQLTDQSSMFFKVLTWINDAAKGMTLVETFKTLGWILSTVGAGILIVVRGFEYLASVVEKVNYGIHQFGRLAEHLKNFFSGGGWNDDDQLEDNGINAGESMAQGVIGGAQDKLQIHSPSKVFEVMGQQSAAGFDQGFEASAVASPYLSQRVPDTAPSFQNGQQASSSVNQQVHAPIEIHIHGTADDGVLQRLKELLPGAITSAFEQVAMEVS